MIKSPSGFLEATWTRALVALLVLASPVVTTRLAPNEYLGGYSRDSSHVQQRNSSAIAAIMGEFRTSMADLMFIKTERYLHNGVAYALHLDMEASTQKGELTIRSGPNSEATPSAHGNLHDEHSCSDPSHHHDHDDATCTDHEHDHDHEGGTGAESGETGETHDEQDHADADGGAATIIRSAGQDFRGFIGDLERAVKPWQSAGVPHEHTPGTELLPWYRVLTLTDPKNVRGYLIGAWWLSRERTTAAWEEALAFAREGISNNPDAYQLYLASGNILRDMGRTADSREAYRDAADIALKVRPRDVEANPWWTRYMEEDARASARLAVLAEKEWGSVPEALRLARSYNRAFEDGDGVLSRQIDEMTSSGLVLESGAR